MTGSSLLYTPNSQPAGYFVASAIRVVGVSRTLGGSPQARGRDKTSESALLYPNGSVPTSTNEFCFWTEREIEDHLGRAAVELLRQLETGFFVQASPSGELQIDTSSDSCSI